MGRLGTLALRELLPMGRCACAHAQTTFKACKVPGFRFDGQRFISNLRCFAGVKSPGTKLREVGFDIAGNTQKMF